MAGKSVSALAALIATLSVLPRAFAHPTQHVLQAAAEGPGHQLGHTTGANWSLWEQDNTTCAAGSRHFTGRVNVTDDKSLFFWFFESRQGATLDQPIVIWMNGGPGSSSIPGMFGEIGPCIADADGQGTTYSPASWNEHANLLVIDQPAGVGLSTIVNATEAPHNLPSASVDFVHLLKVFYGEIFPQYSRNDLFIAAESFGGQYGPFFSAAILRQQIDGLAGALQHVRLRGLVLVNAIVSLASTSLGFYDLFCTDDVASTQLRFNDTVCEAMARAVPECERLGAICLDSMEPRVCEAAATFCQDHLETAFEEEVANHRHSRYDVRQDCQHPPLCDVGRGIFESTTAFLNRSDIQQQLGFDEHVEFVGLSSVVGRLWAKDPLMTLPTNKYITYLLNGGATDVYPHSDAIDAERAVSVLILNGEYDAICNTPGNIRLYDNLPWYRQAAYRVRPFKPWYWTDAAGQKHEGGLWKGTPKAERGLEFLTVHDAGHMAPGDQREGTADIFARWLKKDGLLGETGLE